MESRDFSEKSHPPIRYHGELELSRAYTPCTASTNILYLSAWATTSISSTNSLTTFTHKFVHMSRKHTMDHWVWLLGVINNNKKLELSACCICINLGRYNNILITFAYLYLASCVHKQKAHGLPIGVVDRCSQHKHYLWRAKQFEAHWSRFFADLDGFIILTSRSNAYISRSAHFLWTTTTDGQND